MHAKQGDALHSGPHSGLHAGLVRVADVHTAGTRGVAGVLKVRSLDMVGSKDACRGTAGRLEG